jgi:hypothetical protein
MAKKQKGIEDLYNTVGGRETPAGGSEPSKDLLEVIQTVRKKAQPTHPIDNSDLGKRNSAQPGL